MFDKTLMCKLTKINVSYHTYLENIQSGIRGDTRTFWQYIKDKKMSYSIPNRLQLNGVEYSGGKAVSDAFAQYFGSVYSDDDADIFSFSNSGNLGETVSMDGIEYDDVCNSIRNLKTNKSIGPDKIPPYIVKGLLDFFAFPLKIIFNLSLKYSTFPDAWKEVKVCPIFKKGVKTNIENYRPIAVLNVPAKIFESIINDRIYFMVSKNISQYQHGFVKNKSTVSNLCNISQFISESLNDHSQVDVIYTDYAKAFDTVSHAVLLQALWEEHGFNKKLIDFFRSYLCNRCQRVVVRGYTSHPFIPGSGVPQGSNLGPLLFLLFINSLVNIINNSKCLLFADDLKLYAQINTNDDSVNLQNDLNRVLEWSDRNKIAFNVNKCYVMSFTRKKEIFSFDYRMGETVITRVNEFKDLGVIFDNKLTMRAHVISVSNKASSMYGFLVRSTKEFNDIGCIKQLYISLVRSILEYASVVWNPYYQTHIYAIERVQNRFLRYLYYKETGIYHRHAPRDQLLDRYKLGSLENRRKVNMLLYLHKLINGKIDDPNLISKININVPVYFTRHMATFYVNNARTNYYYNSPINSMCNLYNHCNDTCDIFYYGYDRFKNQLLRLF